jgi:hypothetical protein
MKRFVASSALALALFVGTAFSQYTEAPRFGVSVAGTGQLPVGDFADVAGLGYGGLAGIELGTYPGLALTARTGYIQFLEKDEFTTRYIPIMGGLKVSTADGVLYLTGEVGAVLSRVKYGGQNILQDDEVSKTNLGWNVGLGGMAGPVDLRLSFNVWDGEHMSENMTIGLTLGFTVFSF